MTNKLQLVKFNFIKILRNLKPLIVEYTFADGSSERIKYPVQVWRKNDKVVRKVMASENEITNILIDPDLETADIDMSNNSWPKKEAASDFENFIKKTEN